MAVAGGLTFVALDVGVGGDSTCGIATDDLTYCWGLSPLGDGTTDGADQPVPVATNLPFTAVTGGSDHACALATTGDAYCWGHGDFGKRGMGAPGAALVPTLVSGCPRAKAGIA